MEEIWQGKILAKKERLFTALLEILKLTLLQNGFNISLGTVYRNMAMFVEQGLIVSIGTVNGRERFDADTSLHAHFICDECEAVIDLDYLPYDRELDDSVALNTGHSVKNHSVFFHGKCRRCVEKSFI